MRKDWYPGKLVSTIASKTLLFNKISTGSLLTPHAMETRCPWRTEMRMKIGYYWIFTSALAAYFQAKRPPSPSSSVDSSLEDARRREAKKAFPNSIIPAPGSIRNLPL